MITATEVWQKLSNSKYRAAFARTQFKRLVPLQIQTLRKQRGWSQQGLAEQAKLTQGVVSRAEDQDYGNLTVNTILNIAEGFDVAFVGRFVPFSELNSWYVNLSRESMRVPSFDQENEAMTVAQSQPNSISAEAEGHVDDRFGNSAVIEEEQRRQEPLSQSRVSGLDLMLLNVKSDGGSAHAAVGGATRSSVAVRRKLRPESTGQSLLS